MSSMRHALARVAALSAVAATCVLLGLAFWGAAGLGWQQADLAAHGVSSIPWLVAGFVPAGALLAWQRPHNPIGWLMLATGLVAAVVVAAMVWIVAPGTVGTLRLLRDDL